MTELLTTEALEAPISVRSEEERLVELRIVPWGVVGRTREGPERFRRGAFRGIRPEEVTLEAIGAHGADPGVRLAGRAVELDDREDGEYGTFRVSRTRAGDELLELARDGVYRSASAVFEPGTSRVVDGVIERQSARLRRVGIVESGAYPGAEVLAVRSAPEEEGTVTELETPAAPATATGVVVVPSTAAQLHDLEALRADMLGRMAALEVGTGRAAGAHPLARWETLGAYLADASSDPAVAPILARALADQTTADNPGVVPPSYLGEVRGILSTARPAVAVTGGPASLGDSGMSLHFPYYDGDLSTLVGKQAAEKTEIVSVKVSLKDGSFPISTFAGGSDVSYQLIRRSSPAYLEAYGRIMLSGWALTTEKEYETDLLAGATGSVAFVPGTADDAAIRAAFFAASIEVRKATGSPATWCLAASDVFASIGGALAPVNPQNATGEARASTLVVNVSGLNVTEAPYFPDGAVLWGNGAAARWHEDGPMVATAEDVAKLGQNRAYWSMGATGIFLPAGLVKAVPTLPLSSRKSSS